MSLPICQTCNPETLHQLRACDDDRSWPESLDPELLGLAICMHPGRCRCNDRCTSHKEGRAEVGTVRQAFIRQPVSLPVFIPLVKATPVSEPCHATSRVRKANSFLHLVCRLQSSEGIMQESSMSRISFHIGCATGRCRQSRFVLQKCHTCKLIPLC